MSFRIRESRFRHVFGKPLKRTDCFDNIRITKTAWDSTFCAANPKYIAIITESAGGGSFLVLPLNKPGRIERDCAKVSGHTAGVLDIAWCPWHDNVIASASEDCTVKIWQIPEGGLVINLDEPIVDLVLHQRRVGLVIWHPTANNVLLSAGSDNKVVIWNVGTSEPLTEIEFPDICLCASFNPIGNLLATTCKDKMLRIIDPRTGSVVKERKIHDGSKPSQCAYLRDNKVFTTGFSRMSERQYALWDADNDLDEMCMEEIDSSNGVMFPFYDSDTNLIYLAGKGDSCIRYFEISAEEPYVHYLNMYQSGDPQRGMCMMPKRGVNVNACEINRFFKLHTKGLCEIIPMTVPRKSELFQDDLYPDTPGDNPSVSAEDWFSGVDAEPILISLRAKFDEKSKKAIGSKTRPKSSVLSSKMPNKLTAASTPAPAVDKPRPTSTPMASKEPAKPAPVAAPTPVAAPAPVAAPTPVAAPEPAAAASAQAALPSSSKPVVESPKPAKPLIESKKPEITAAKPDAPKPSETNNTKDALIEKLIAKIETMEAKSEAMEAKFEKQQSRITALEEKVAAQEADRHGELEMDNLVTENGDEEVV